MKKFDFEEWQKLAESDPEAFELRRQQEIESLITSVPSNRQQRLRGLQWRVDMERQKTRDPLLGCQKVFNLMWKSVYGDHGLLQALNGLPTAQGQKATMPLRPAAKILAFQDDALEKS
jgi:hypothetical protein